MTSRVTRSVLSQCVEFESNGGPLKWRNLEMLVNEEDEAISLNMDGHLMGKMGYSVETILGGAREKECLWDETTITQNAPVCNLLQCCEKRLYEDEHEPSDEKEEYLLTPEVGALDVQDELIHGVLENKIKYAKKRDAEDEFIERLKKLFLEYEDVFRVEFEADP